jgi:hypothetical protein
MHHEPDTAFQDYFERTANEPVYVILGVQGSGTNFLGRLLKRFFGFSLLRDRSMVFNAAARLGNAPTSEAIEREIRRFRARAFPSAIRRKTGWVLGDYAAFPGIIAELRPELVGNGASFARLIYAYRAYRLGTTRMAIKSDDLWETIDAIDDVLPNRRTILITRDFRDNLVSISDKPFGPIEPIRAAAYVKQRFAPYAAEFRRAGQNGYHVKFETLVTTPRQFLAEFSEHFQLAPTVDLEAAVQRLKIRPMKTQKWRRLSSRQLAWCEGMLRRELEEFGYVAESEAPVLPGRPALLAATASDISWRIPQKIRRLVARIRQ